MSKLLRLAVSIALVTWIGVKTDWQAVSEKFASLNVGYFLASVLLFMALQAVSAWRWRFFARALHFDRPVWQLMSFYYIGMYFGLVLPTSVGGDVVRAWYLDGGSGRKLSALGTVFLDRLNGVLVLITIACLATAFSPIVLPAAIPWTIYGIGVCAVVGMLALPLLARWKGPGGEHLRKIHRTICLLHSPGILWITTLLSFIVQAGGIVILWMIGMSLDAQVPGSFYWVLVPLMSLLMLVPISINGWGVRENGMILMLAPFGIADGTALTMAFLWFANGAAVSLLGGLVYLFGHFPRPESSGAASGDTSEKDQAHGPVDRDSDQGRAGQCAKAA